MRSNGSGPAAHEDCALFDRVTVPVIERDRGALPEGQLAIRTVHVDEISAPFGSPADYPPSISASGGHPREWRWRRLLMQWLTHTRVNHDTGRSMAKPSPRTARP